MAHFLSPTGRAPCKHCRRPLYERAQRFDHIRGLLFFWEKVLQHYNIRMLTFYICRLPLPSKRTDRRHVYIF